MSTETTGQPEEVRLPAPLGPRYETAYELGQRTGHTDSVVCTECGVFVMNVAAHDRFHLAGLADCRDKTEVSDE